MTWPISQCPTEVPYYYPDNIFGYWYTYPPATSGTCLNTVSFHSFQGARYAKTLMVERLDGLDCGVEDRGARGFCLFNRTVSAEVPEIPGWLDPGDPSRVIDAIGTATGRLEQIH